MVTAEIIYFVYFTLFIHDMILFDIYMFYKLFIKEKDKKQ